MSRDWPHFLKITCISFLLKSIKINEFSVDKFALCSLKY